MRLRVLIAVTHLLGAGHLTRAAAIGRALARCGHGVTLVSGGIANSLVDLSGMTLVQLDPVRAHVGDFSTLLDEAGRPIAPGRLEGRREALLAAYRATRPDVVVTELFPFGRRGLREEYVALLDAAASDRPRPAILCSVRDILVAPAKPDKVEATHALLRRFYDRVLVHGDEAAIPLEASWPLATDLRPRLRYTGYVGSEDRGRYEAASTGPEGGVVLVSGGSSAAALPLYRAALEAARIAPGSGWHVLVGPGIDENAFEALRADAPRQLMVERARADFRALLSRAAVFVGQAGYNTVMDLVATRARAVLVPFEAGRETEQRMRADRLAEAGHAILLPEADLGPTTLAAAVARAAERPRPRFEGIRLDGAEQAARAVEEAAAARSAARPGASSP